ncbi:RNA-directed DNA polymerase, eukaryota [Tanacetum coccineum]
MAPKRATRSTPAALTPTTTTVTNAQLKAMIDQGVTAALEACDADRSMNGDDNHNSGTVSEGQNATVGHDVAYAMTWTDLKKKMTDKYCLRGEMKKLEIELWELKVKGTDVDAIEMATELMDKKINTLAERQAENKRKLDNNNQAQQQPPKKQGVAIAYTVGSGERKEYAGTLPLCNKCKFHHNGPYTRNLTCYECGNQGHYMSDCPELKNQNHGNQAGGTGACVLVHALGGEETDQDLNTIEDEIEA